MERLSPKDRKALQQELDLRQRKMATMIKFFWPSVVVTLACFGWVLATQNTRTPDSFDMSAFVVFVVVFGCGLIAFVGLIVLFAVYTYNSRRVTTIQHMLNRR